MENLKNVAPIEDFNWDAYENGEAVTNASHEELEKAYDGTLNKVNDREVVDGTVIAMNKREVVVNIGYKSDGIIPLNEFRYNPDLKVGDTVEVYIENQEDKKGQLVLSHRKARATRSWDRVNAALENEEIIKGYIKCRTKGTVRCDIFNSSFKNLSFFEFTDDFFLLLFQFSFDKSLVRYNDILEFLIDLNNLEFHSFANEYIVVADRLNVDLRTRQECFDTEYVNDHTTLSAALDVTLDNFFIFQSSVNAIPRTGSTSFAVRQNQLSFFVFLVFDVYLNSITNLQFRIVTEFTHRNDTV